MSQRARVAAARAVKISAPSSLSQSKNKLKSKKKVVPSRKITRSSINSGVVQKKPSEKTNKKLSATKLRLQKPSSVSTRASMRPPITTTIATTTSRKKRLSGLTAATLLQYCTNVLSPTSNEKRQQTGKRQLRSTNSSPASRNNQNIIDRKKKRVRRN